MSDPHAGGALAHHFDDFDQQRESASLGMWLFIVQEILFFGGLFTAYVVYRYLYPSAFVLGSKELDIQLGGFNTAVLILSSLTMALAVWSAQVGKPKLLVGFLIATLALGLVFLGVKYVEYSHKFEHHLVPGSSFHFDHPLEGPVELFFSLYFAMTGMHALHMVIGMGIIIWMIGPAWRGRWTPENYNVVEGFGLYWHFVDIVWIFLFPMLYLLGRN